MKLADSMILAGGPGSGRHKEYTVSQTYKGFYQVHKAGCKAALRDGQEEWTGKAENPRHAAKQFLTILDHSHGGPGQSGWKEEDFKVHNCTKGM